MPPRSFRKYTRKRLVAARQRAPHRRARRDHLLEDRVRQRPDRGAGRVERRPAPSVDGELDVTCAEVISACCRSAGASDLQVRAARRDEGQRAVVEHGPDDDRADAASAVADAAARAEHVPLARPERRHFFERVPGRAARLGEASAAGVRQVQREPAHQDVARGVQLDRRRDPEAREVGLRPDLEGPVRRGCRAGRNAGDEVFERRQARRSSATRSAAAAAGRRAGWRRAGRTPWPSTPPWRSVRQRATASDTSRAPARAAPEKKRHQTRGLRGVTQPRPAARRAATSSPTTAASATPRNGETGAPFTRRASQRPTTAPRIQATTSAALARQWRGVRARLRRHLLERDQAPHDAGVEHDQRESRGHACAYRTGRARRAARRRRSRLMKPPRNDFVSHQDPDREPIPRGHLGAATASG